MINTLYLPELREMLAANDAAQLRSFCTALHPGRTAEFMEALTADETWAVFQHADPTTRVEIFRFFDPPKQVEIVQSQPRDEMARFIGDLPPDDRVDLLNEVDPQVVDELLPLVPIEERRDILRLRAYPESTAGAVMTTEVARLSENLTVQQTLDDLRTQAEHLETIYYLYIVDDADHLRGVVSTRRLVSSMDKPDLPLHEFMERELVTVHVTDDQEDVANKVARYNLHAIPVVDDEHRVLGIITADDVIDVVREEATEDAHRISAVDPLTQSYLQTDLLTLARKRALWLTILFFGATLTAFALDHYNDDILGNLEWLVLFIPLVISSGGNTGSQSATLIITALAVGDITLRDWSRVVWRELLMGLLLGGFLATVGFLLALWITPNVMSAAVVATTLLLVIICGTLSGSLLPLLFQRLGLDPAMMSNPFVAGIIDILGIVIYMNVARSLLS